MSCRLPQHAAEEAVSDAIEWASLHLDDYDPQGRSLLNWVHQRARWRALDYLKLPRAKLEMDAEDVAAVADTLRDPRDDPEAVALRRNLEQRILDLLAETPELLRFYRLRRAWSLTNEQVADNLGISVKEVKNLYERLMRALRSIRAMIEEEVKRK